jgi:molybdopterin molybdotransferase
MDAYSEATQRIARLTPLGEVLARIDSLVTPVAPRALALRTARGRTLAEDVVAAGGRPASALALRDGWALRSELTADAGPYAPVLLPEAPLRVDFGEALPAGCDAVAPLDTVAAHDGLVEVIASVAPGEGVLAAAVDAAAGSVLKRAGERLGRVDIAALAACGIARVSVREPRVRLVHAGAPSEAIEAAFGLITSALQAAGASLPGEAGATLEVALDDAAADAVIVIGGTGSGRNDSSVRTLARVGRVECHGVALTPGETAAFGFSGPRPVLLLPGRVDAALAVWLVIGSWLLSRLTGGIESEPAVTAELSRKVASNLGLAEIVPVRLHGDRADPLASGYLPLVALAQADGWILVPAKSEGYPVGTRVAVRPWP